MPDAPYIADDGRRSRDLLRVCGWGWLAIAVLALAAGASFHAWSGSEGEAGKLPYLAAIPAVGASAMYFMLPPLLRPLVWGLLEITYPRRPRGVHQPRPPD